MRSDDFGFPIGAARYHRCVIDPDSNFELPDRPRESVARLFMRFLRFGMLAWGGPTAQIEMMHSDLVEREKWVTPARFRRVLGVYQALPGPEATEMACYFGMLQRGRIGAIVAGLGFILPGLFLMFIASWLYVRFGMQHPIVRGGFEWCRPAVIGLMALGCSRLGQKIIIGEHAMVLAVVACVAGGAHWLGAAFWIGLMGAGVVTALVARRRWMWVVIVGVVWVGAMGWSERTGQRQRTDWWNLFVASSPSVDLKETIDDGDAERVGGRARLTRIALTGVEAGMLTFGGAYTAIPVVEARAVWPADWRGGEWLSREQFLDSLAIGGVLPAPLIVFATMVGYVGGGFLGAIVMTVGIFLPAFSFTLIGHRYFERLVDEPRAHAFLEGVAAAAVGIMAATTLRIGFDTLFTPRRFGIAVVAVLILIVWKWRLATPAVVLGAAAMGAALAMRS